MTHKEKLLKWLDEYYDKERKANHDYIARRYRELEEK